MFKGMHHCYTMLHVMALMVKVEFSEIVVLVVCYNIEMRRGKCSTSTVIYCWFWVVWCSCDVTHK